MILNIFFMIVLWLSMLFSLIFLIPAILLIPFPLLRNRYVRLITGNWSFYLLRFFGIRIKVTGKENLPDNGNFIIVSNHQGNMDIPVMLAVSPYKVSFIAKKEVLYLPFFNLWFFALGCLAIDRKKTFAARRKINKFLTAKRKNPVLIFPEGTRSRGPKAGKFKTGGLLGIYKAGVKVIPMKIDGSYRLYEENSRIRKGVITVEILPQVEKYQQQGMSFTDFVTLLEKKLT
jgi:1-acyl-sn-glycerol-3-phosphate acyltransferase